MRGYKLMLCCESLIEERSAGNPHATFCGNWRWVTASDDPVVRLVAFPTPILALIHARNPADGVTYPVRLWGIINGSCYKTFGYLLTLPY